MDMIFRFDGLSDFFWMGGHGPYVWACYAMTFLGLIYLAVGPMLKKKSFLRQQRAMANRGASKDLREGNSPDASR